MTALDDLMRRRMQLIVPHVRRAVMIGNAIDLRTARTEAFAEALDGLSAAMFLVDAKGGIVHANISGHAMLGEGQILRSVQDVLTAADPQAARVLRDVITLVVQAAILVLVGVAFGLRAPVAAVFIGFGFIVLVAIGLASVSYATGLLVKSEDAFAPLINTVVVPLLLLSGIFLPLTLGPGWLQGIARISPFR